MPAEPKTANLAAPIAMTIAGSDSGSNAGVQADLLTFAANQVYGVSAITCLTAQNPERLSSIKPMAGSFVREQIDRVSEYFKPAALKTGMLFSVDIIEAVIEFVKTTPKSKVVIDPVMVASSGELLLKQEAVDLIKTELIPLADIITPNLDEGENLLGAPIGSQQNLFVAAAELASKYKVNVLLKGGHLKGSRLLDVFSTPEGNTKAYEQNRIDRIDTHGSGCTLSAAITANLTKGKDIIESIELARSYLRRGMESPVYLKGIPFINHFPK